MNRFILRQLPIPVDVCSCGQAWTGNPRVERISHAYAYAKGIIRKANDSQSHAGFRREMAWAQLSLQRSNGTITAYGSVLRIDNQIVFTPQLL